eukprot:Opistho-2@85940
MIWTFLGTKRNLTWMTEADVQFLVQCVISDAAEAVGISIHTYQEINVDRIKGDIWVVARDRIPIGVIEVKCPTTRNAHNDTHVYGQLFNYMARLRALHNVRHVFGILTTYDKWRVCWLDALGDDKIEEYAASTDIPPQPARLSATDMVARISSIVSQLSATDYSIDDDDNGDDNGDDNNTGAATSSDTAESSNAAISRNLNISPVYTWNDKDLPTILASTIVKMAYSPREDDRALVAPGRAYSIVSNHPPTFEKCDSLALKWKMPNPSCKTFILLKDLHGGAHGRVYLACSKGGHVCVLKFPVAGLLSALFALYLTAADVTAIGGVHTLILTN